MAQWLRQSTAATVRMGPFVDSTDGYTAETLLAIVRADIRLTKNSAAFDQTNNVAGATHDENGFYAVPLDTTDTNTLGRLRVAIRKTGALPVWQDFLVVAANIYDSLIGGGDTLDVAVTQIAAGAIDAAAIATDAIDADAIAASAIDAGAIAVGAITNATFAAGAIDTNALATDAADEIADHVWDEAIAGHVGAGSTGATLNALAPGAAVVLNAEITEIHVT